MSKLYGMKLEIWEVPKWVKGSYSGKLNIETEVRGATNSEIRKSLENLLEYFNNSWERPRDKKGHFIKLQDDES